MGIAISTHFPPPVMIESTELRRWVTRIERSDTFITGYASTLVRIQAALEKAGIEFIENDDNGGFGLRFSKKRKR